MGVTVLDEKAEISHRYSTLEFYSCEYNGKKITPSVSFPFHTIICGYDYEKKYSNNVDVGMGKLVITGKGAFKGKNTFTFSINPLGTKIVSVSKAKKAFTAKWKKQSAKMAKTRITGYQVQYSASSSFKNSKTVAVKGYSKTSATIKKLKANKKYYVRVRTYKTVSGKNFCSSWSRTKSVVTR